MEAIEKDFVLASGRKIGMQWSQPAGIVPLIRTSEWEHLTHTDKLEILDYMRICIDAAIEEEKRYGR